MVTVHGGAGVVAEYDGGYGCALAGVGDGVDYVAAGSEGAAGGAAVGRDAAADGAGDGAAGGAAEGVGSRISPGPLRAVVECHPFGRRRGVAGDAGGGGHGEETSASFADLACVDVEDGFPARCFAAGDGDVDSRADFAGGVADAVEGVGGGWTAEKEAGHHGDDRYDYDELHEREAVLVGG